MTCLVAVLFYAHAGRAVADSETLPLPQWPDQELETLRTSSQPWHGPAHRLWPDGMIDMAPLSAPGTMLAEESPSDSPDADQPHADLSHFLPPSLISKAQRSQSINSSTSIVLHDVSATLLQQAEASPASERFIDPSHQVPEVTRDALTRFLESHARDARIKLYVLMLGPDEKLPSDVNLASLAQGSLLQNDACLAVCPLGEPWRLRLFMSRSLHEIIPPAQLAEVLDDTVRDALQAAVPEEQLHRLLVRLSIRLFWLESALPAPAPAETIAKAMLVDPTPAALPEIVATPTDLAPDQSRSSRLGLTLSLIALLAAFIAWRRHVYRQRHYEWVLPEPPTPITPRFGCPHAATAAWVQYQ